ncbi:MAG TPA: TSUP family transporter, partial [Syntrophomonas sp.]|nr:TSUP family transporter [Syntrophomonas sp.]
LGQEVFPAEARNSILKYVLWGLGVGVVSGLTGIGGGVILVPVMVIAMGFSIYQAIGTSSITIAFNAAGGIIAYAINGLGVSGLPDYCLGYIDLLQFALLGKAYAGIDLDINEPRIALLNNGEEETKGNSLAIESYRLLKAQVGLNFIGNIEGRDIFSAKADVIVCDGFTGNILLKAIEGLANEAVQSCLHELGKIPSFLSRFDYSRVGGAPLLGVEGISIVCHGSSKREAVYNGIKTARDCVVKDIVKRQKLALTQSL